MVHIYIQLLDKVENIVMEYSHAVLINDIGGGVGPWGCPSDLDPLPSFTKFTKKPGNLGRPLPLNFVTHFPKL